MSLAALSGSSKKVVLLVEPDREIRELIVNYFNLTFGDSASVVVASDGVDGTNRARNQKFDCIISEDEMPLRTGEEFVRSLRDENLINGKTPVVILREPRSALWHHRVLNVDFIDKPIEPNQLMGLIDSHLKIGYTDQKIMVSVLNAFISCFEEFMAKILGVGGDPVEPKAKEPYSNFFGGFHYVAKIELGSASNRYLFGFDEMVLQALYKGLGTEEEIDYYRVCSAASGMLLKYGLKNVAADAYVVEKKVLGIDDLGEKKKLARYPAIELGVKSDFGNIYVYAMV